MNTKIKIVSLVYNLAVNLFFLAMFVMAAINDDIPGLIFWGISNLILSNKK